MPRKPRAPKPPKAKVEALVAEAARADLPLETAATVTPPEHQREPVPEPKHEPVEQQHVAKRHPRSIETKVVGDARVHLIDTGYPNRAVGVRLDLPDGERPSDAVKAHLRDGDAPLSYQPDVKAWLKRTGHDPASDRIDVEMRFADAVQTLRAEKEPGVTR